MATLIANAATTQNLTGAATFAAAETGALATVLNRFGLGAMVAAGTGTSPTFTVTTAKVIDAVLLWVRTTAASPTGTFKVDLQKGGVSQASVTVNKADLPDFTNANPVPVLFKLTSTATGDGAANWTIVVTTTGTVTLSFYVTSGTATFFTRALRTTTAQTAAAADDLYIVGELTGAGTKTTRTVTMDSTATTAYGNGAVNSITVAGGGIHVSCWGTLAYGNSASTNYILRINGDLIAYQFGTFTIGATGAEIPRNSTAILEFQQASADGDFGLRCEANSTVNMAGLSRTFGKNVVACKLTADVASANTLNTANSAVNGSISATALEATGNSLLATGFTDSATNTGHFAYTSATGVVTNTTQTGAVWLARGSGTNNRYVRMFVTSNDISVTPTNAFYVDIDLQAGTVGTATAIGNATATSASIVATGTGYWIKLVGKASSGSSTPRLILAACSAAGTVTYVGNTTQCFIFDHSALVTTASLADTTFSVDTDTGWLSGDAICVASTSRTGTEAEIFPLNANAGSSSMTSALYPGTANVILTHLGTAPRQGEVINLTRNVKVQSTSATLMSYVYASALATINFSWVEFRYFGSNNLSKRGLEIDGGAATSAKSVTYCSFHDFDFDGLYCSTSSSVSLNLTFSNNVAWLCGVNSWFGTISGVVTNTDWTFDSNTLVRCTGGWSLTDVGGTFTNNIVSSATGGASGGFHLLESQGTIGNFNGNKAHSCGYAGLVIAQTISGTISNFTAWRNNSNGVWISVANGYDIVFDGLTLFGNLTQSFLLTTTNDITIKNASITSDVSFASSYAIQLSSAAMGTLQLDNVDMSATATGGGGVAHSLVDLHIQAIAPTSIEIIARNCKFGTSPVYDTKSGWTNNSYMSFEKFNQTTGDHRTELKYGTLRTDSTVYNTATPSMRMTPNDATNKLQSASLYKGIQCAVNNGNTVTATAYVRKSTSGDGAAYTGNQPRLVVRANPAIGITSDTVLATYSTGTGSWNALTGTTATATDDGVMEFIVDCDGTAGWINVDDWSFTTGGVTSVTGLKNWFNGLPVIGVGGDTVITGVGAPYFSVGVV